MERLANEYKIGIIGDELLTTGFRLAGVKATENASNGDEAEKALRKMLDISDIGIIVITEGLANQIKDRRLQHVIDTSLMPLIIEVPGYNEEEKESDTLRRLILKAVGIDITKMSRLKS
ncbi:MAG: V-type ATP synthase subunit F [Candidatus Micrarchaeia archaeon]